MSENTSTDTSIQGITALIKTMFPKIAVTSPESSLLECGVDSISIMRLVSRWRKNGIKITFAELITEPTLKSWSEKLSRRVQKKEDGIGKDGGHPEVRTAADDESEYELTDVQYAYWVGRDENQQLGGVSCHAYLEITGKNIDENRLDTAFSRLIEAHPMLRTIFTQNGRQRNVKENHNDPLKIHDFRNSDMVSARRQAEAIRERNSHRKLDISRGKVIGLELLQYPDGTSRIFFDVDLLVSDVQSLNILLHDLAALYSGKNIQAPENWSFRQYLEQQKKRSETEFLEAEKYWKKRIESMPSGPQLPYTGNTGMTPHFTRYKTIIGTDIWNSIKKQSLAHGITPAMTLAAAYGMVISRWSSSARFLINVPLFNRDTENENIEHAVADFTNLLLLECDYSENLTFAEHAKRLQGRFHQDCAHTAYSAIRVLRELARNEYSNGLTAPVVFACNLGTELTDSEVTSSLGTLDYMISQTPQVCLDHQIYEMPEGLMVCFDAVDSMFPKGLVGTMFSAYTDLLAEIGSADDGFGRVYLNDIPKGQLDVRKRINSTGAPVSDTLLAERIFTNAETRPDSPALFYGDSTVTYGQMHASVMRVASLLIQHGVKPLDRIAVSVPRGPLQIISVLAVLA
ncbi:MAG: AMP-binding protein, partial [Ruminobacter sp.]|uniref:condensation domain-containing protein n=1 Tax=Ruminobacter sp. TaxID=2774296 RepID=UPI00257A4376